MIFFLIIFPIILFILFIYLVRSAEVYISGEGWVQATLPLWSWILLIIVSFVPILNIIGAYLGLHSLYICGDIRFKRTSKISRLINKVLNILNKRY